MSIRIYALAKQLKKESKELVDVCKKLGISNKANPLSSLSEDEAKKISDYFSKDKASSSVRSFVEEAEKNVTMQRPPILSAPSGKVPVLQPARPARLSELSKTNETFKPKSSEVDSVRDQNGDSTEVGDLARVSATESTNDFVDSKADAGATSNEADVNVAAINAAVDAEANDAEATVNEAIVNEATANETNETVVSSEFDRKSNESTSSEESVATSDVEISPQTDLNEDVSGKMETLEVSDVSSNETKISETGSSETRISETSEARPAEKTIATEVRKESVFAEEQKMESEPKNGGVSSEAADANNVSESTVIASSQSVEAIGVSRASEVLTPSKTLDEEVSKSNEPLTEEKSTENPSSEGDSNRKNPSDFSSVRKTPLRDALDRRESQRDFRRSRDKDASRSKGVRVETKPLRPVPPILAQQESRAQILDEMKRPPMITPPHGDRLRVVELPRKNKKDESNGSNGSQRPSNVRPSIALHLAPMPTQAPKTAKKVVKEPVAQKPEMRLPPEAIRAAAHGVMGPLTEHIRSVEERNRQQNSENGGKNRDKEGRKSGSKDSKDASRFSRDDRGVRSSRGDSKTSESGYGVMSNDFGSSNKRGKKSSSRDHEGEGREDVRSSRRRQGNEARRFHDDDSDYRSFSHIGRSRKEKGGASTVTAPRKGDVAIEIPCTVKQFAETTGISVAVVIKKLMELGYMLTLNQSLEVEVVELLIVAFDLKATIKAEATLEEKYVEPLIEQTDSPEDLVPRAPVVTFLGHVDHGKTSLLDRILHLHVVSGEKGGITQHIRAYRVSTQRGAVTFVDTPGHEAFTEMRARGANCTDVAVLVVAADDGVMPQTEEAISHAKAAGVPIVVALNKMDLPDVNRDKVVQELASNDLMPSEWGGDVEIVETSAVTGMGVDDLLDTLLTVAELNELKANPNRPASGVILEASLQSGEGVVCKALVQNGTLRNGDVVLCGSSYGRVRSMTDTLDSHKRMKEAGPSVPVSLVGLDVPPEAGSRFVVLEDVSVARQIAEERAKRAREVELAGAPAHVTLENLFERMNSSKTQQTLNVVIRADVRGSIEAIRKELGKLEHPEVKVKILQASVGGITEADVHLADASDAIIVGFNVVPDEGARALAETKKVQVRRYDVIYKLTEDIRAALEGMLKPIEQVKELGRALVQRAFNISRVGVIAGCRVLYGVIERDCRIRVIRDSRVIGEYQLETLKREKDDVKEVRDGYECGMKLKNFNDVKEGDVLEAYKIEEVARTL